MKLDQVHKVITTITLTSTLALSAFAAPVQRAGTYFGGSGDDEMVAVRFASDGTIVAVGNTTSSGNISGKAPTRFGTDPSTVSSTGFVARYSNDGRTLLSYTRFAWGMTEIDSVAVNSSGIYVVGFATAAYAPLISSLGGIDRTAPTSGKKPFIAKFSTTGTSLVGGTYLAGVDTDRDELGIDILSSGDVVVMHDNNSSDYLSKLSGDLKIQRWRVSFGTRAGSCRPQALSASKSDNKIYVAGYGMGNTTQEPLKGPFAFKFDANTGVQEWKKSNGNFAIWNWSPREGDGRLNGLISDSTANCVAVDSLGHAFIGGYSDGGATVFSKDPNDWTKNAINLDGDGYWGFSGATSAGTVGRLDKTSHQWIRLHAIHPRCTNCAIFNRTLGVTAMASDKALWVGIGRDIPNVSSWYTGGNAFMIKAKMDSAGTTREWVCHYPSVDRFISASRQGTGSRYAIVGVANATGAPTPNGAQTAYGGGTKDGFLVVMDDQ